MTTDSIRVDAGQKEVLINQDKKRVLKFNPTETLFAKKFYALLGDFDKQNRIFKKKIATLEADLKKDKHGLPKNLPDSFALMDEMADWIFEQIDNLFGEGTSEMVFQGKKSLEQIEQFFEGLVPYIEEARTEKIEKYTGPPKKKG